MFKWYIYLHDKRKLHIYKKNTHGRILGYIFTIIYRHILFIVEVQIKLNILKNTIFIYKNTHGRILGYIHNQNTRKYVLIYTRKKKNTRKKWIQNTLIQEKT